MIVLKPETAKERQEAILRWIIQQHVETRRPVASETVAKKSGLKLSSATIRNAMKKLEEEGFLLQSHVSGGRVPTDKAYRLYVDYLSDAQRLALTEKTSIERAYNRRLDEIDSIMSQTSRMLAALSHSAGFVFSANVCEHTVARLDFIPLSPDYLLAVLVTESGAVRHWPIKLSSEIPAQRLRVLGAFLNQEIAGLTLKEAQKKLWRIFSDGEIEVRGAADMARQFLSNIERHTDCSQDLHVDGLGQLLDGNPVDFDSLRRTLAIMEEKKRFSLMLSDKLREFEGGGKRALTVTIGTENSLKEFRDFSMVSCVWKAGERAAGMLGILGPRHMEYAHMISLVDFMGELMEKTIAQWERRLLSETPDHEKKGR